MAFREKGPQTIHLLVRQPIQVIYLQSLKEPELHPAVHINGA